MAVRLTAHSIFYNATMLSVADKALITGASGFIGSHLTQAVVRAGADVVALVHYNSRNDWGHLEDLDKDILGRIKVVTGDVRDAYFVRSIMKDRTVVFHLAALIAIPYSYSAPAGYVATNVEGTLNVLQAAVDLGIERVVQTSTSEVYGTACYTPMDEAHPLQAQSPYAASKIAADKLAESFHRSFKLPMVTIRPFNTYGPRQSARAIVPTIVAQALAGTRVRLGSLAPVRDLCFVADTVRGFLLATKAPGAIGKVINLCTERGVSIGELAERIFGILGVDREIEEDLQRLRPRDSEVMKLIGSAARAREVLGWVPEVTLDEGLTQTIAWMRTHAGRYKPSIYNV
jgi:NAD dependent epimerase/dehydratase